MAKSIELSVAPPFHLEATVRMLQRRPTNPIDRWEGESWLRLHQTGGGLILTRVENAGSIDRPLLRLHFEAGNPGPALQASLVRSCRRILGLDVDPAQFVHGAMEIPPLRPLAVALRGMRPPRFASLMESFGRIVPYQQLSLDAGTAIVSRLIERFGPSIEWGGRLYAAFPSAEILAAATVEDYRSLGFSRTKGRTLIDVGKAIVAGELSDEQIEALPTDEAYRRLLALWGVGPWTAGLILLRGYGRLESFPAGDAGVKRGLATLLGEDPKHFDAERYARSFGDQRGMVYFYSLGASLLGRGLIRPAPLPAIEETGGLGPQELDARI